MTKLLRNHHHLKSNFGKTGQKILKSTTITLVNPGDRPHYNDPRLHPDTNEPIPGTRMYDYLDTIAGKQIRADVIDIVRPHAKAVGITI